MTVDLLMLDARIARAYAAIERGLLDASTDPFDGLRDVAGQSTFQALGAEEDPHRDGLRRWVHELLQVRVGRDLFLDEAEAIKAKDPTIGPGSTEVITTFEEARRALIEAAHPAVAERAYDRLDTLATPVAAVRKELRARRFEAARRLGLDHPWALAAKTSAIEALARTILDETEALARELQREPATPATSIYEAFARDAREGWPAHLGARWLEDVFRAIAVRPPRVAMRVAPLGGASFLLAAETWGVALRQAAVARSLPFALARDPYPTEARVVGGALAAAVAHRTFAKRKLGLTSRGADAHARSLERVLFVTLRRRAAEVLAGMPASPPADMLEELTARLYGKPLGPMLAIAWASGGFAAGARVDAPARFLGAVRAYELVRILVDRFDEDWFDNPRAGTHLASIGAGPIWQGTVPEPGAAKSLARAFEERLG